MDILTELKARNVINNITNEEKVQDFVKSKKYGLYCGFDPSFRSLHLGNYLMLVTRKRFVKAGYKTIALVGGATGQIGDPSGKKAERVLLENKLVEQNVEAIKKQIESIVTGAKGINNLDFYKNETLFDFLRDTGKLINVNYLLEKEIIAKRLESGISYAEFTYTLIQAHDFCYMYKHEDVHMQLGGSDQWGNITAGTELIRRTSGDDNGACGITMNLLTKSDGTKFGKSEGGAFYLDKSLTSPYAMYQFLINQADEDVKKLLLALTFISVEEIEDIMNKHNANKALRLAQKTLAKTIITDIHGADEAEKCEKISATLFSGNLDQLDEKDIKIALNGVPTFNADKSQYDICDLLVNAQVCPSKSNARQLVQSNSISVNGKLISDIHALIDIKDAKGDKEKFSYIKKGKKNYFLVNWK